MMTSVGVSTNGEVVPAERVKAGWAALARGGWAEARAAFEAALSVEESPEALEG